MEMNKTIYKLDNKNKLRQWTIEVQGNKYRSLTGIVGGKIITNDWTVAVPKNIGRANATTGEQQALSEAQSQLDEKIHEGYVENLEQAKNVEKPFEPMLAHKYNGWEGPVWSQPKLDGIRCLASSKGLFSRNNKEIVSTPHIFSVLEPLFSLYDIIFDGELYNHELKDDFNKITSLVRKTKKIGPADLLQSEDLIQYHVYDCFIKSSPKMTFENRIDLLQKLKQKHGLHYIHVVDTHYSDTEDKLMEYYQEYLSSGYEGQMVRVSNSLYETKRSNNLLKRKPFHETGGIEKEYIIDDIYEGNGNWSGKAKALGFTLEDGTKCRASIKGTMEYAEMIWNNKDKYIGKLATVVCQNLTPAGVPRFPIAKDIGRDDI